MTDTQNELTSKVGSMKSLLALPSRKTPTIPKDQQISAFDYLLKVLKLLGIDPQVIFSVYLTKVFDEVGFLEDKVVSALADSFGESGYQLSPYVNNPTATSDNKKAYKASNRMYLPTVLANNFLEAGKQQMVKELMIMIFGNGPAASALSSPTGNTVSDLVSNAVCGVGMFNISNDPIAKDSDLEYTRIKKRTELEKGQVIFEISCQEIKITLPDDPGFMFSSGGIVSVPGAVPPTPSQSITILNQYVGNQFQKINNEKNASSGGKSFLQHLLEMLMNYISTLVQPYLPDVFTVINAQVSPPTPFSVSDFTASNCDINNDLNNPSVTEDAKKKKKEFMRSLVNALLKDLIKLLLMYAIKYFKRFVKNYFAKKALERQKRKMAKQTMKFDQIMGKVKDAKDKIEKYQAALSTLTSVLGQV